MLRTNRTADLDRSVTIALSTRAGSFQLAQAVYNRLPYREKEQLRTMVDAHGYNGIGYAGEAVEAFDSICQQVRSRVAADFFNRYQVRPNASS